LKERLKGKADDVGRKVEVSFIKAGTGQYHYNPHLGTFMQDSRVTPLILSPALTAHAGYFLMAHSPPFSALPCAWTD
jgi:hypothetical protein